MAKTRKDLIREILCEYKQGLHVNDIAKEILNRRMEENVSQDSLALKISAVLSQDIKKNKGKSEFRRIKNKKGGYKQGWYRLKKLRKPILGGIRIPSKSAIVIPSITKNYIGKAGEYAVLSELLFNEFNVSLMSVDEGIDIVASKDNQFYYIQVKTAHNRNSSFHVAINKKQFERYNKAKTFYVFVLRYLLNGYPANDFVVLNSIDIEKYKEKGVVNDGEFLGINISVVGEKIMLNDKEDITPFYNKFEYLSRYAM